MRLQNASYIVLTILCGPYNMITFQSEHNALLVKLAEFEEEKIILKNLLDDLRLVFILRPP